jgi:hypothetical protein
LPTATFNAPIPPSTARAAKRLRTARFPVISFAMTLSVFTRLTSVALLLVFFSACATTPQKHALSDTPLLVLGKTTPAECRATFGEPQENDVQNGSDGKFENWRYVEKFDRWGKRFMRLLLVEFKDGVLNGYAFGSSFAEDHTTFAVTNLDKIEWAASTQDEVSQLLGKPQGKLQCPTRIFNATCKATGQQIWVYLNFNPVRLMTPGRVKRLFVGDICTITFDNHGLVTNLKKTQAASF